MKLYPLALAAVAGAAVVVIVYNPRPVIDVCCAIFKNKIVQGAGSGFLAGLALSTVMILKDLRAPAGSNSTTTMGAAGAQLVVYFAPPILGTLAGALIGGAISLSHHIAIQIK